VLFVLAALVTVPASEPLFVRASQVGYLPADPKGATAAVDHDDWQDYASNEPTMDGTASAVLLMALQRPATSAAASRRGR
jgi:hypothetical protein